MIRKPVTMRPVTVSSTPPGATVLLHGRTVGVTPTAVLLNLRDASQVLRLEMDGYQAIDAPVRRTISPVIVGNAAFALLALQPMATNENLWSSSKKMTFALVFPAAGAGLDLLTGAAYKRPSHVHVNLERQTLPTTSGLQ